MRKYALPAALLGGLMSCSDLPTAPSTQSSPIAPSISRDASQIPIPGQYIVRFRSGVGSALANAMQVGTSYGGTVDRVYTSAINGAAMHLADDAALALASDPRVLSVEPDEVFTMTATTQVGATWGLDRIDQRARPLSGSYVYAANGSGVTVYILDTGINFSQSDFGGRAETGFDAITPGGSATDCEGHGSHVAGTIGSNTYGVAKNVRLVAVRVLDCSGNGSSSSVLAGIDWVTTNADLPAVANMSIGSSVNATVNQAVENSILAGITYAVSAGNNGIDACQQTPASAPDAITVGATDASDTFASFSNFGTCVDVLAPGVNITSWWTGSGNITLSGTSMSSPHVAGAAALYLQTNPMATPAQVRAALVGNATAGAVIGVPAGTPNLLLYTGFIHAPSAPVANFTSSCVAFTCSFDASTSTSSSSSPTYQWSFGDAKSGTGKTPTHTYATGGTFAVTLTVTDTYGSSSTTTSIAINRPPNAVISTPANNASFAQGASITFAGTGTDPEDGTLSGTSLTWASNLDGIIGTGASLSNSTLSVGVHTITLIVKDSQNALDTATVSITITANHAPTATITAPAKNASFLIGSSVTFSGAGNDVEDGVLSGASLVWTSNIDGTIGTGTSFTTTTLSAGTHTITLTAKDALKAIGTATLTIRINRPPVASITSPANNALFPQGSAVAFAGTGTDPEDGALTGSSLVWTSSRDGQIGTGASFVTSSLSVGTHTITLTSKDALGATGTATRAITIAAVNQPPVARFTVSCPTLKCALDASSSTDNVGIVKYTWSWGDGRIENRTMSTAANTWTVAGMYTITLVVTDGAGLSDTASKSVSIPNQSPTAIIALPANGSVLVSGTPVTFVGAGNDFEDGLLTGSSLVWTSSVDGQIGTGVSFTTSSLSAGTHVITLTASDVLGFTGTATRTITINRPPTAAIVTPAVNANFIHNATVTFTGTGIDPEDGTLAGGSLVWTSSRDGQIGTGASFSTSTLSVGTHAITLTASDTKGAIGSATLSIVIMSTNQPPVANFTFSCNGTLHRCSMDGSSSTDNSGIVSYKWNWGDGRSESHVSPTATNTWTPGTYNVTLTVTDTGGLTNSITKVVTVP
jgi:subtilisin family serine protease